jgi:hypothetical protein
MQDAGSVLPAFFQRFDQRFKEKQQLKGVHEHAKVHTGEHRSPGHSVCDGLDGSDGLKDIYNMLIYCYFIRGSQRNGRDTVDQSRVGEKVESLNWDFETA